MSSTMLQKVKLADACVRSALAALRSSEDDGPSDETIRSVCLRAVAAIDAVRRTAPVPADFFRVLLDDVGFNDEGATIVNGVLQDADRFLANNLASIARGPALATSTRALLSAHEMWMRSAACRRQMLSAQSIRPLSEPLHASALFSHWLLEKNGIQSVKAELLMRFHLYIRSGWCAYVSDAVRDDPKHCGHNQHVVAAVEAFHGDQRPADSVSAKALLDRFATLFVSANVGHEHFRGAHLPMARLACENAQPPAKVPTEVCIDALIRGCESEHQWHIAAFTSEADGIAQDSHLPAQITAVLNSIDLSQDPFSTNDTLGSVAFYSPALIASRRPSFLSGGTAFSAKECRSLNALALFCLLADERIAGDECSYLPVLLAEHWVVGGSSAARGGTSKSEHELVSESLRIIVAAADALLKSGRTYESSGIGCRMFIEVLKAFHRSLVGMRGAFPESATDGLLKAVPRLKQLAATVKAPPHRLLTFAQSMLDLAFAIEHSPLPPPLHPRLFLKENS